VNLVKAFKLTPGFRGFVSVVQEFIELLLNDCVIVGIGRLDSEQLVELLLDWCIVVLLWGLDRWC
jgi:hypothetical protein